MPSFLRKVDSDFRCLHDVTLRISSGKGQVPLTCVPIDAGVHNIYSRQWDVIVIGAPWCRL